MWHKGKTKCLRASFLISHISLWGTGKLPMSVILIFMTNFSLKVFSRKTSYTSTFFNASGTSLSQQQQPWCWLIQGPGSCTTGIVKRDHRRNSTGDFVISSLISVSGNHQKPEARLCMCGSQVGNALWCPQRVLGDLIRAAIGVI